MFSLNILVQIALFLKFPVIILYVRAHFKTLRVKCVFFLASSHARVHKTVCNIRLSNDGGMHESFLLSHDLLYSLKLFDVLGTRCICSLLSNARL
jgi:hypothetical protein